MIKPFVIIGPWLVNVTSGVRYAFAGPRPSGDLITDRLYRTQHTKQPYQALRAYLDSDKAPAVETPPSVADQSSK